MINGQYILLNYENEEDAKNLNLMKSQIKIKNFLLAEYLPENIEYSSFIELSEYNGCENLPILKQLDKKKDLIFMIKIMIYGQ